MMMKIPAYVFPEVDRIIIEHLKTNCRSGDVVLIMSNGKFDNIHLAFCLRHFNRFNKVFKWLYENTRFMIAF